MPKPVFVPRYRATYDDLRRKIEQGTYPPGQKLPNEQALCLAYGVERVTVRRALEMLVQDGWIEKRAGVGSFVTQKIPGPPAQAVSGKTILFLMQHNQNDIRHNATAFNALLFFPTELRCKEAGYSLLYMSVQPGDDAAALIAQHAIAGVFLVSTLAEAVVEAVASTRVPTICLNTVDPRRISILPDNLHGSRVAVDALVRAGHRRIAFIGGMQHSVNANERHVGYREALAAHGIPYDASLVSVGNWTFDGGKTAMRAILERFPQAQRPTAVYAASDMMAIGAMETARDMGLHTPGDLSVIGFDNIDMCNFCTPALTSISIDSQQMAGVAVELMDLLIRRGQTAFDRYILRLPADYVERGSITPPGEQAIAPAGG